MDSLLNYRALVVDDDPSIRQRVTRFLAVEGFRCHQAQDGIAALEMMKQEQYDVVVTDLRMPREHGFTLVQRMQDAKESPVVIVLTGVTEPKLVRHLLLAGVDDVMFKPIDLTMFAAKVRVLVETRLHSLPKARGSSAPVLNEPTDDAAKDREAPAVEIRTNNGRSGTMMVGPSEPIANSVGRIPNETAPLLLRKHTVSLWARWLGVRPRIKSLPLNRTIAVFAGLLLIAILAGSSLRWGAIKSQVIATVQPPGSRTSITITANELAQMLVRLTTNSPGKKLTVKATDFTDRDVHRLAQVPSIDRLDLEGSAITDGALTAVAQMHGLTSLGLHGTPITTAGLRHIQTLPNLTELDVSHTKLDDESLDIITHIPKLKLVDLSGNNLSTPAVMRIRRRCPHLTVRW